MRGRAEGAGAPTPQRRPSPARGEGKSVAAARRLQPGGAAGFGEFAHAQDVALPLGDRDHAARVEQVEGVARLDALVVGRQRHQMALAALALGEQRPAFGLGVVEVAQQRRGVGVLEIEARIFLLGLQEHVAVGDLVGAVAAVEVEVVDVLDPLHVHRQPLEPVGQLARHRRAFEAGDLLKVGELRHFHAVAPAFPAEPPGAERRALPVVLDEAHVVQREIDADRRERVEIELLQIVGRRLEDHLVLVIVLQPVGVLAVAAVLGPARRLDIGGLPRLRPERAQRRRRMEGAGADLHVVGLENDAALPRPEILQRQDQALEGARRVERGIGRHYGFRLNFRAGP